MPNYKIGQKISAISFEGPKIIGEYRGSRNSYGVWVFGIESDKLSSPKLWACSRMSIEVFKDLSVKPPKLKLCSGDLCSGLLVSGEKVSGQFMNLRGNYAFINGWASGSRDTPARAFKVLKFSLTRI